MYGILNETPSMFSVIVIVLQSLAKVTFVLKSSYFISKRPLAVDVESNGCIKFFI